MTHTELIANEIDNLEQKMKLAETAEDLWYIFERLSKTLHNDQDLGKYIRKISRIQFNNIMDAHEKR